MGHEQTEIDALAALRPDDLRRIAEEAVRPFFDDTLKRRSINARDEWGRDAQELLESNESYVTARDTIENAQPDLEAAIDLFNESVEDAREDLDTAISEFNSALVEARSQIEPIEPPEFQAPEPEIETEPPEPIFTTGDDWKRATQKLIRYRNYETN